MSYNELTERAPLRRQSIHHTYDLPQPEGLLCVREYLLTTLGGKRCCLLRWQKAVDAHIDSITFELIQSDLDGEELERRRVTLSDEDFPSVNEGEVFTPTRALPVCAQCATVRVRLIEVVSGAYIYRVKNNRVQLDYIIKPTVPKDAKDKSNKRRRALPVLHSKRPLKLKRPTVAAVLAVVFLIVLIFRSLIPYDEIREFLSRMIENAVEGIGDAIEAFFDSFEREP